jgi:hypothetical protein
MSCDGTEALDVRLKWYGHCWRAYLPYCAGGGDPPPDAPLELGGLVPRYLDHEALRTCRGKHATVQSTSGAGSWQTCWAAIA